MSTLNKSYALTTTQLKKFEGFENITEDEAKEIIFQLKELSQMLFGIFTTSSTPDSAEFVKENNIVNKTESESLTNSNPRPLKCKRNKLTTKNIKP